MAADLTARTVKTSEQLENSKRVNETFGGRFSQLQQAVEGVGINSNILLTGLSDADSEIDSLNTNFIKSMFSMFLNLKSEKRKAKRT